MHPNDLRIHERLRPYQLAGIEFLSKSQAALLADEMGLGKTVQAAVAIELLLQQGAWKRVLVITPASLTLNWKTELERWGPSLVVRRVQGSPQDRAAYYRLPIPVLIASYEQIRVDAPVSAPRLHFDLVLLDEAQRIKNADSAAALACRLLPRDRAWALTGTPVENTVEDLVSIFQFMRPGLLRDGQSKAEMHTRIREHFLRRRKADVLGELPPIIVQDLLLELNGRQAEAYDELWSARRELARESGVPVSEAHLLALITKLKQLCNFDPDSQESIKLDSLRIILESLSDPSDKILIFSQYVRTLEWLSRRLCDFPHDLFHGGLSEGSRAQVLARFQAEPGPRALLISLKAGGVGLNLNCASSVVLFDRWWNPAVEDQAINRAHRFGRSVPLHVFRFLVVNTIEDRIARILKEKKAVFDAYVEEAESAVVSHLSRGDLKRLLELNTADVDIEAPEIEVVENQGELEERWRE